MQISRFPGSAIAMRLAFAVKPSSMLFLTRGSFTLYRQPLWITDSIIEPKRL